jgi:hypothetical protein
MNRGCGVFQVVDSTFYDHRRLEKTDGGTFPGCYSKRSVHDWEIYQGCLGKVERIPR